MASEEKRGLRERKAGPPLLEGGGPEPPGKAKRRSAPKKKKSKASKPAEPVVEEAALEGPGTDADQLYCICLEPDDGRPMIECDGCENWYHLECMKIDEDEAKRIKAYFCPVCEAAGSGKTAWNSASTPKSPTKAAQSILPPLPPIPVPVTPSDSGGEYEDKDYFDARRGKAVDTDDEEYSDSGTSKKNKSARRASSTTKRKRTVVEDEEDADERAKRRPSIAQEQFYVPVKRGSTSGPRDAPANENVTRRHCTEQLEKVLKEIFTSGQDTNLDESSQKARELGVAVEANLFNNHAELEPMKSMRMPKTKYLSKFRSLQFSLKSSEYFRSRVGSGDLDAAAIVEMRQEDILSPEQRAEQEAIKERSLAQSVKVAVAAPKTKFTRKGEEVIDELDQSMTRKPDAGAGQNDTEERIVSATEFRERSESVAAGPPVAESSFRFASPPAASPTMPSSGVFRRPFSPVQHASQSSPIKQESPVQPSDTPSAAAEQDIPENSEGRPPLPHNRSDSISKSKLDLDRIWGAMKQPPDKPAEETPAKGEDDMDTESDDQPRDDDKAPKDEASAEEQPEDYDPFAGVGKSTADDDFDAIMGGSQTAPQATTPAAKLDDGLNDLPSVWEGRIDHPEEGSYETRLVQVAGPHLGVHPHIWDQILPKDRIVIAGRLGVEATQEYLNYTPFSKSKDAVLLAHLPRSDEDRTKHDQLVESYIKRKRMGVCPPTGELKKRVKDHYLIPIRKQDAVPDYMELYTDFNVPPERGSDYFVSLVMVDKSLTGAAPPKPVPSSSQTSAPAPQPAQQNLTPQTAFHGIPGLGALPMQGSPMPASGIPQPGVPGMLPGQPLNMQQQQALQHATQPGAPNLDPSALQSLLSNPSLLQSLSSLGQPPAPGLGMPMGAFPGAQAPFMGQGGMHFAGPMGMQQSPPWQGSPSGPPQPGYGQPANQWNPAGSPPWQGGQPGAAPAWNAGPNNGPSNGPGPGYIHPDRIKQASEEARRLADGPRGRGDHGRDDRRSDRRDEPRRGGRDDDHGRREDRRPSNRGDPRRDERRDSGNTREKNNNQNQMRAGIQDRGWGARRN